MNVEKEVQKIIEEFTKALADFEVENYGIERPLQQRAPNKKSPEIDKNIWFENAPKSKDKYFLMEKKKW